MDVNIIISSERQSSDPSGTEKYCTEKHKTGCSSPVLFATRCYCNSDKCNSATGVKAAFALAAAAAAATKCLA